MSLKAKLYRDIEIEGSRSLYDLAGSITAAFDFGFDHAFGFYSDLKNPYRRSGERYELFADMEDGDSDAGSVELMSLGEKAPKTRYPRVISKVGKAPPQYPEG